MQIMAIRSARNYLGDELIRTAPRIKVRAQSVLKALTQDTRKSDDDPNSILQSFARRTDLLELRRLCWSCASDRRIAVIIAWHMDQTVIKRATDRALHGRVVELHIG